MPTRAPRRDSVENRAGILDAARETLAADPRASIDVIARSAGLSRRTLYGHFDDREALIRELISVGTQRFNAIAESVTDTDARIALARLAARLWQEASHVQVAAALALDEAHVQHTADALAPLRRTVVSRTDAASIGAENLAVRTLLSIAGLSWREADDLLTVHPEIIGSERVDA